MSYFRHLHKRVLPVQVRPYAEPPAEIAGLATVHAAKLDLDALGVAVSEAMGRILASVVVS